MSKRDRNDREKQGPMHRAPRLWLSLTVALMHLFRVLLDLVRVSLD